MKENTWLWIFVGVGAYYLLKSQAINPNQATAIDPLTGKPYTAPPFRIQMDPITGMYANPMADPCNALSPVANADQCAAQGRSVYGFAS